MAKLQPVSEGTRAIHSMWTAREKKEASYIPRASSSFLVGDPNFQLPSIE